MKSILCFSLLLLTFNSILFVNGQPSPFIGLNSIPLASDLICQEPVFSGSFYTSGYGPSAVVSDFKLYESNGDSVVLSHLLSGGKPVLIVSGSLTCPIFRNKLPTLNQVVNAYAGQLEVIVIYTIEAHPTDTSVYFGYVNITSQNQTDGILFPSPQTYGERKALVDTLLQRYTISAPVYIDGPCNPWWKQYGPAPNNAYVIRPDGKVAIHHGWFDRNPRNIFCELDTLLGVTSGMCNATTGGSFTINILNQTAIGAPGSALYAFVDILNSGTNDCEIDIFKLQQQLPTGWETSFCADICYATQDDSIRIQLPAGDTMHFSLDYFTTLSADTGNVRLGFRNVNHPNNQYAFWCKGDTRMPVNSLQSLTNTLSLNVYPNPFSDRIFIPDAVGKTYTFQAIDDRLISSGFLTNDGIECSEVPKGMYIIRVDSQFQRILKW
jgi:hypothetical protein